MVWTSLIKCCWMMVSARGKAFTLCELLMKTSSPPPCWGLKLHPTSSLRLKLTRPFKLICSGCKTELYDQNCSKTDLNTSSKCYWSLLKTLLNRKKIPYIPPLFYSDKYIVDFQDESKIFSSFFGDQCSTIWSGRVLPSE